MNTAVDTQVTSRRLVRVGGALFSAVALIACVLVARRLSTTSWPLGGARASLVFAAAGAYLAGFVLRALGWQRLFPAAERPDRSRCLAACGAAAASGVILPFRLDYAVKVSTLRRLGGVRVGLEAIGLSIVTLGLVDAVAMLPLATAALATSGAVFRAPLIVILLFCVGCVGVLFAGRHLADLPLISRCRLLQPICRRIGEHTAWRSTLSAGVLLLGCWLMRGAGNTLLLIAFGVGFSPTLALVVLCMAAAASILPITAGGALVSIGATSGVLVGLGVTAGDAVNFSLAAGLVLTTCALVAAFMGVAGSLTLTLVGRHRGARVV